MLDGKGAVWEDGSALQNFLKGKTKEAVAAYEDNLGSWIGLWWPVLLGKIS